MASYNPYNTNNDNSILSQLSAGQQDNTFFANRLIKLSMFGRNYQSAGIKNAKGIHKNEDTTLITDNSGNQYTLFSRKVYALMQERQRIAALSGTYLQKIPLLREYASKVEISDYVSKLTNEIVVYGQDKKFCDIVDLPNTYPVNQRKKLKEIFENVYTLLGFGNGTFAWDVCRDWLVDGYICREIIYDRKGKNIIGFLSIDPATIIPIVDPQSGLQIWLQNPMDTQNQRIFLDAEIVYVSYSGASNYMETSYVEPLIRPYNELKSIERAKLLFNLINATMHKQIKIPTTGMTPMQAEQQINELITSYKDHIAFDDTTGHIYIDGSKDLPYSKEYWLPNDTDKGAVPEVEIIDPAGHDLNENSMLIWFKNALKQASKFPFTRLDSTNGGGNIYSMNGDATYDDYNFDQYKQRLRNQFKEILLKPVISQFVLSFPETEKNNKLYNDIDIEFFGHSEIIKAKKLQNLQAISSVVADLTNNFKRDAENPVFHWKYLSKHFFEFTDEEMAENEKYWKEDTASSAPTAEGGGGSGGGGGGGSESSEAPAGEEAPNIEEIPEAPAEESEE